MKMKKFHLTALLAVFFSLAGIAQNEHKIEVKIKGFENQKIKLGYYFEDKQYIAATTILDKKGYGVFQGDSALKKGLYMIILPQKSYFDLLIADDQKFSLQTDTANLIKSMKVKNSLENEIFFEFQRKIRKRAHEMRTLKSKRDSLEPGTPEYGQITKKMNEVTEISQRIWQKMVEEHPETFFATLITAMNGEPAYKYNKEVFFEHIDFSEAGLIRTPVLHRAMQLVLARNLNNHKTPEKIIEEVDMFIEKSTAGKEVQAYVTNYFLNFFATFHRDRLNEVFVYIAENYYLNGNPHWMDSTAVNTVRKKRDEMKASMIGQIAKNIELQNSNGEYISLYDVPTKYTLLFFWKTGCGHCEDAMEMIRDFYKNNDHSKIEVFAVFTKDNKKDWHEFIDKHGSHSWINTWDPERKSKYQLYYYVVSTPILYLLDEDKRIVAKRLGDAPIKNLLEQLVNQNDKF